MRKTLRIPQATKQGWIEVEEGGCFDSSYPTSKHRRGRVQGGGRIVPTLTSGSENYWILTDIEMEREKLIKLIQPFVFAAKKARVEDTYEVFLEGILDDPGYSEEERMAIHKAFSKFLRRHEGKGWCFEFETCRWFRVRKLTPRECFRLMDVPEEGIDKLLSTTINKKGEVEQVISNSQLYKCAGNSIVVEPMALTLENVLFPQEHVREVGEQMTLF